MRTSWAHMADFKPGGVDCNITFGWVMLFKIYFSFPLPIIISLAGISEATSLCAVTKSVQNCCLARWSSCAVRFLIAGHLQFDCVEPHISSVHPGIWGCSVHPGTWVAYSRHQQACDLSVRTR